LLRRSGPSIACVLHLESAWLLDQLITGLTGSDRPVCAHSSISHFCFRLTSLDLRKWARSSCWRSANLSSNGSLISTRQWCCLRPPVKTTARIALSADALCSRCCLSYSVTHQPSRKSLIKSFPRKREHPPITSKESERVLCRASTVGIGPAHRSGGLVVAPDVSGSCVSDRRPASGH